MSEIKRLVIIGYGRRGEIYGNYAKKYNDKFKVVAVAEPNATKRDNAANTHNCEVFETIYQFLERGIAADIVAISSQDEDHVEQAILCMRAGYDILLEKPIATTLEDCLAIQKVQRECNRKVIVCHVLRYTPFYRAIKKTLDDGVIGDIINIHASENVGYYHQAHSFVRGPWKNAAKSTPMIVAKCCHDLDIFCWLIGAKCKKVASFGSLRHFNPSNAPCGSADYCSDCQVEGCVYRAQDLYQAYYAMSGYFYFGEHDNKKMLHELAHSQYDACVYKAGNDVVDHQTVSLEFENEVTVSFTLTAFSKKIYRDIKIHGTKGELVGLVENDRFEVRLFDGTVLTVNTPNLSEFGGHSGGDKGIMDALYSILNGEGADGISLLDASLESHIIAFNAEKARVKGEVVELQRE